MNSPSSIPLQDPRRQYLELRAELDAAVARVADSGHYVLGPEVEAFEDAAARYLGVGHAVGVGSGTDALVLALQALGVGRGDEVITSPFSFFATAEAILHAGARPVFADIRPDTFNLDPDAVLEAMTDRAAAILPIHLYGQMAEMPALRELADRHGLALLEDAAQAFGAAQARIRVGSAGETRRVSPPKGSAGSGSAVGSGLRAGAAADAGCFSFYPTKNLGGWGDGGLVTTYASETAARVRRLRDHGRGYGAGHRELGYNSRLDALQAAVLRAKLPALDGWNARRREHAGFYGDALDGLLGITPPGTAPGNRHIFHQYTIRCRDRPAVVAALEEDGIGYGIYYAAPLHLQEPLVTLGYRTGDFPEAERAAGEVLSLPVFPGLRERERERIVRVLRRAMVG